MLEKIKSLILEGKSAAELQAAVIAMPESKGLSVEDLANHIELAQKDASLTAELARREEKKAAENEKKELEARVTKNVLETLKVGDLVGGESVSVSDNWKADAGRALQICAVMKKGIASAQMIQEYHDIKEKSIKRAKAEAIREGKNLDSIIAGADESGGFLMPYQFDMEVDKLTAKQSALISELKIKQGTEKTEINSIGEVSLSFRTNENTAFTTTKPQFDQQEIKFRDAGALTPISNRALEGSAYNVIDELLEQYSSAKIKMLEELIVCGSKDAPDNDPFDGIRFHAGVTAIDALSQSGKLLTTDLSRAFLACASETRQDGIFVMSPREAMLLAEEKGSDGHYTNTVEMKDGNYIHKPTGKKIIVSAYLPRTLNGVADRSTGTDVPVIFAALSRLRVYQLGGTRIDMSKDFFFDSDTTAMRFIMAIKWGIPIHSRSSFVTIQGVKGVEIS